MQVTVYVPYLARSLPAFVSTEPLFRPSRTFMISAPVCCIVIVSKDLWSVVLVFVSREFKGDCHRTCISAGCVNIPKFIVQHTCRTMSSVDSDHDLMHIDDDTPPTRGIGAYSTYVMIFLPYLHANSQYTTTGACILRGRTRRVSSCPLSRTEHLIVK